MPIQNKHGLKFDEAVARFDSVKGLGTNNAIAYLDAIYDTVLAAVGRDPFPLAARLPNCTGHVKQDAVSVATINALFSENMAYYQTEIEYQPHMDQAYAEILDIKKNVSADAAWYINRLYEYKGQAAITAAGATDIPMAEVSGAEAKHPQDIVELGYRLPYREIEMALFAGTPLAQMRAEACLNGHRDRIDDIAWYASEKIAAYAQLQGILTVGSWQMSLPTGHWFSSGTTGDNIYNDMCYAVEFLNTANLGVKMLKPNRLLLELGCYQQAAKTRLTSPSDRTALELFNIVHKEVTVEGYSQLSLKNSPSGMANGTYDGTATYAAIAYRKDPRVVTLGLPRFFQARTPVFTKAGSEIVCETITHGVVAQYPQSIAVYSNLG